ncbi:MAG: helix-turn-helix domain-containing protein [Rhizobiales bacterium]|nr:helix-turn-helix domain-containing protein [Hyphomicrobiales bacterium]
MTAKHADIGLADIGIGEMARLSGCKVQTVRYYEETGLMPEPARNSGNQRRYGRASLERLKFIRHCRNFGFGLNAIRELLSLSEDPNQSCEAADKLASKHLAAVILRIEQLQTLREELTRMTNACAGGIVADCRVVEMLADHSMCDGEH